MAYTYKQKVLFKYCDPAGMVFYPRYFEMLNDTVEAFFEDVLNLPFDLLHETSAIPTVEITTRFRAPSRLGDKLEILLQVQKVGRSSLGLSFKFMCQDQVRLEAESTLVHIDLNGRPQEWPNATRSLLVAQAAMASD